MNHYLKIEFKEIDKSIIVEVPHASVRKDFMDYSLEANGKAYYEDEKIRIYLQGIKIIDFK